MSSHPQADPTKSKPVFRLDGVACGTILGDVAKDVRDWFRAVFADGRGDRRAVRVEFQPRRRN